MSRHVVLCPKDEKSNAYKDFFVIACIAFLTATVIFPIQVSIFTNLADYLSITSCHLSEFLCLAAIIYGVSAKYRLHVKDDEISRVHVTEKEALDLAYQDALTGMPNRRQLDIALSALAGTAMDEGKIHALLMIDLNGFKRINDVYGHPVGDQALVRAAARIRNAVRENDLVVRLGGDEFAVLALDISATQDATILGSRIIDGLKDPVTAGGVEHQMGAGVGIAFFPKDAEDAVTLLRKADVALYSAKGHGRSVLRVFQQQMEAETEERERLEHDLRFAIGTDSIRPFYQPIYDLESGTISGFEALARWCHPELGEVPPSRFIPLADETGLIRDLTDQLLLQACRDATSWPASTCVSFNMSPVLLKDETLGLRIMSILAQSGLPPHRLELEVAETALGSEEDGGWQALKDMHDAGIKIVIDDFGTGRFDIFALGRASLDKIKIDKACLDRMTGDSETTAIVKSVVDLGSRLHFSVTAAGVEIPEQQALLTGHGFRQAQGFLFSAALPAAEATKLVASDTRIRKRADALPQQQSNAA